MCSHPKTDEAVHQFMNDFREWSGDEGAQTEAVMVANLLSH
jgi:hypothetical protein